MKRKPKPLTGTWTLVEQTDLHFHADGTTPWNEHGEYKPDYPGNYQNEGEPFYRPKWNMQSSEKQKKNKGQ